MLLPRLPVPRDEEANQLATRPIGAQEKEKEKEKERAKAKAEAKAEAKEKDEEKVSGGKAEVKEKVKVSRHGTKRLRVNTSQLVTASILLPSADLAIPSQEKEKAKAKAKTLLPKPKLGQRLPPAALLVAMVLALIRKSIYVKSTWQVRAHMITRLVSTATAKSC